MAKKLLHQVQKTGKTYWREILAILFLLVGIFFFRSERRELRSLEEQVGAANIACKLHPAPARLYIDDPDDNHLDVVRSLRQHSTPGSF